MERAQEGAPDAAPTIALFVAMNSTFAGDAFAKSQSRLDSKNISSISFFLVLATQYAFLF